ncbi:phosphatidylglycerophosphatase A [uncultured Desulfosarcina sp.]|uniref:phosphatidylglycerophosphatase A family protein n=1 Tax=uncultured Desulfosarcina sp. TaxID=218289 RepID=UPI0029C8AAF1|nr:phosphatidylglycerophosphatase A [uncultured Desulfosarcina sp.]
MKSILKTNPQKTAMAAIKEKAIVFMATWGLIGFSPLAPGTIGSMAALPLCFLISAMDTVWGTVFLLALISFSIRIANGAEKIVGQQDPGMVVIDEVCGMAVTLFALPFTPIFVIGGFALFRVFDILKPFPIRWFDKTVKGGLGIILDDIVAGIFANLILRCVF